MRAQIHTERERYRPVQGYGGQSGRLAQAAAEALEDDDVDPFARNLHGPDVSTAEREIRTLR